MVSPRAEVANTIGYRRRKGTAAMLEELAHDVTGWPARVVEFFQLLATTQYLNHPRPGNLALADLRRAEPLERVGGAFDPATHLADVRAVARGAPRHNIPNVAVFLWRLGAHRLVDSPPFRVDDRRFLFHPLGIDQQLFTFPETEAAIDRLAEPRHLPLPLSRRALHGQLESWYGEGRSLWLTRAGSVLPAAEVQVCDLSDTGPDPLTSPWGAAGQDRVAIDPVLGRIQLPAGAPSDDLEVSFTYATAAAIGGGPYDRLATLDQPTLRVPGDHGDLDAALTAAAGAGVVEIGGSLRLETAGLRLVAAAGDRLTVQAANGARPTVVAGGDVVVGGGDGGEVVLNGLLLTGARLLVPAQAGGAPNRLRRLRLVHCTLVPGLALDRAGRPVDPGAPSLVVEAPDVTVELERCVTGQIRATDEAQVRISDSVVDALAPDAVAFQGLQAGEAGAVLELQGTTVVGKLRTRLLTEASNTILHARRGEADPWPAPVIADRRQEGCVRFSYLPPASLVPRRYRCTPAGAGDAVRIQPHFTSLRYGAPGYGQLSGHCPPEITCGAEDDDELGALHHLSPRQRVTNLQVRLDEYLRFGLETGILFAT